MSQNLSPKFHWISQHIFKGLPLIAKVQIIFTQKNYPKLDIPQKTSLNSHRICHHSFTGFVTTLSLGLSPHIYRICPNTFTGFVTTHSQDLLKHIHRICHHTFTGFVEHIHWICHNSFTGFVATHSQDWSSHICRICSRNQSPK